MLIPNAPPFAPGHNPYGGFAVARGFTQQKRRTCLIQPLPPITPCNAVCGGIGKGDSFGRVKSNRTVRPALILLRRLEAAELHNRLGLRNSPLDEPLWRRGQFPDPRFPLPKAPMCRRLEEKGGDASNQSGWRLRP